MQEERHNDGALFVGFASVASLINALSMSTYLEQQQDIIHLAKNFSYLLEKQLFLYSHDMSIITIMADLENQCQLFIQTLES